MDARINFVQEEHEDLQHTPMTSAIYALEDVSTHLDILTLEFGVIFEHPPFSPGCTPIVRQLLVRHNLVVEQYHPSGNKYSYKSEIKSKTIGLYQNTGVTVL